MNFIICIYLYYLHCKMHFQVVVVSGLRMPGKTGIWRLYDPAKAGPDARAAHDALQSFLHAANTTLSVFSAFSYDTDSWRFSLRKHYNNSATLVGVKKHDMSSVPFEFQWDSLKIVPTNGFTHMEHRLFAAPPDYDEPYERGLGGCD